MNSIRFVDLFCGGGGGSACPDLAQALYRAILGA